MSAIVIVNNPSQLLFALEYCNAAGMDFAAVQPIAVPTPGASQGHMYGPILEAANTKPMVLLEDSSLTLSGRIADRWRLSRHYAGQFVITPMVNYLPARYLLSRAGDKAVVTDDGAWTREFAAQRMAGGAALRERVRDFVTFSRLPDALTVFTLYPELEFPASDQVVPNRLDWTMNTFHSAEERLDTIILGSHLVGAGYIDEATYFEFLQRVKDEAGGPIEYWPHRREIGVDLDRIVSKFGFNLKERKLPLEAEIISSGYAKRVIYSLPSTSLRTLRIVSSLIDMHVTVGMLPLSSVAAPRRELYERAFGLAAAEADSVMNLGVSDGR